MNTTARQLAREALPAAADPLSVATVQETRELNAAAHAEARQQTRDDLAVIMPGVAFRDDAGATSPPIPVLHQRTPTRGLHVVMGEDSDSDRLRHDERSTTARDDEDGTDGDAVAVAAAEAAARRPPATSLHPRRRRRRRGLRQKRRERTRRHLHSPTATVMPLRAGDNEHDVGALYEDDMATEDFMRMAASTTMYRALVAAVDVTNSNSSDDDDTGPSQEVVEEILAEYRDAQLATEGALLGHACVCLHCSCCAAL